MCVELRELIESAVATLEGIARRKKIEVSVRIEGGGPVSVDGKLVRRAVEDLLGNALKYTPPGRDVSVAVRHTSGALVIEVADRGPGIPAEKRAGMLGDEPDSNHPGMHQGVGLGLYMVERVASGHGGKLGILDREGGGAIFRLELRVDAPGESAQARDGAS